MLNSVAPTTCPWITISLKHKIGIDHLQIRRSARCARISNHRRRLKWTADPGANVCKVSVLSWVGAGRWRRRDSTFLRGRWVPYHLPNWTCASRQLQRFPARGCLDQRSPTRRGEVISKTIPTLKKCFISTLPVIKTAFLPMYNLKNHRAISFNS